MTLPMNRPPTHPGEMLLKEFLEPAGISQAEAARQMGISLNQLNEIIKGKRGITADTAWKLSALFDTTPESWMTLQTNFDLFKSSAWLCPSASAPREILARPTMKKPA